MDDFATEAADPREEIARLEERIEQLEAKRFRIFVTWVTGLRPAMH